MKQAFAAEDLLGRKLGEFVLLEAVGQGASGLVFRAEQPILARQAVVKIARFATTDDASAESAVQRFLGEARLASRIDHPFAAHVYAFGAEPDGLLWIAMELVRGTPLDVFLAEQGAMPIERAVPFLRRLCEVVHTTHEQGIVHRDIKPGNVMVVSRAGTMFPKLLDLGVARDIGTVATESNSPMGTPLYMSPEQWVNPAGAGPPADIYALGALTFEMLMGHPPFSADSIRAIAFLHAFTEPPSLGEGFPPELSVAIGRAMAKRANERFATAIAFSAALGETSGIALDAFNLPTLDEVTRDEVMIHAPQPIAEAVAALEAARSPARARETLWHAARVSAKYVGLVALSCRGRAGSGRIGDAPAVTELLSTLQLGTLDASQWWRLARELCRPFATMAEVHPIPELVGLFFEGKAELRTPMDALLDSREREPAEDASAEDIRGFLAGAVPAFAQALRSLRFLHEYRLVVPHDGRDELWMGVRRPIRAATDVVRPRSLTESTLMSMSMTGMPAMRSSGEIAAVRARRAATAELTAVARPVTAEFAAPNAPSVTAELAVSSVVGARPLLINGIGTAVVSLWPLVQVEPPSPGFAPELFLLDGRGRGAARNSARLTSVTGLLERSDGEIWSRLGLGSLERSTGGRAAAVADEVVASEDDAAPYRGLSTFTESDAGLFFGREREVEGFVNRLRSMPLIAVVGPSGAGKSSFVQAGVLPGLGPEWTSLVVRPGNSPLANLCARLASFGVTMTPGEIRADAGALGRALRAHADAIGQGLLLVVDQFEELFTLSLDEPEHEAYAQALVEVAPDADDMVRVVITLRDDFLVRAAGLVALRERLAASLQLLTTPAPADLLRILREPARRAGYEFEDDALPKEMVDEVANQPAALALLSFTAYQLWQFRDRHFRQLPRKAYVALGGVGGALAQHAEAMLSAMTDAERDVVREVFRHLVTAGGTRAVLSRVEILQVAGGDVADPVLEKLIQARLLVAMESAGGSESIEVVHEALLSAWPRLVRWRQEDAEGARLRDQLRAAARQWQERGRGRGLLWRGEALAEYQLWRRRYPGKLTDVEEAFGAHSGADARRGRRLRRGALITVGIGLVVALIIFARLRGVAEAARGKAQTMLETSWYEQGRAASFEHAWKNALPFWSHYLATRPADAALRHMLSSAVQARGALIWEKSMHPVAANNVLLSRDQKTLLSSGADGSVVFSDAATGQPRWSGSTGSTINALFAGGDGFFATGPTGTVELDPSRGVTTRYPHADYWTIGAACGTDTVVTVGYGENKVKVWSRKGTLRYQFALDEDPRDMLCRDADHVLVLTEKHLWDVGPADARKVRDYAGIALAISTDHTQIAVAHGSSSTIDLLDASLQVVRTLAGHPSEVKVMLFSPDGKRLLSGDHTGEARVWTVADGTFVQLVGHAGAVTAGGFAANGTPVTLDDEATLRAWTSDGIAMTSIDEPGQGLALVAGDGVAYVGYSDGAVRKLQLAAIDLINEVPIAYPAACLLTNRIGQQVVCGPIPTIEQRGADGVVQRTLDDGLAPGAFTMVQLSDRGDVIAFGAGATDGRFFPAKKATAFAKLVASSAVYSVAALNDRDWAVAATDAGELVVWDHDGAVLRRIPGVAVGAHALAAHPTRPWIAMPGPASSIVVVDVTTGSTVATLKGHVGEIRGLVFSADGSKLYSASSDGSVRIWDGASWTQRQVLWGHRGGVEFVEEIAGGLLASAGVDGTVLIWDPSTTVPIRRIVVSRTQPWALEAIDGGAALAILDPFGIRTWRTPLIKASDAAIRTWLACAVGTGLDCSLR